MSYQQGQPLRADPVKLTTPVLEIRPGQPTFVPNTTVPAPLAPYFPAIVSFIQQEVEIKVGQSPLRMHAHNLLSPNGFQTPDFVELVEIITSYINYVMTFTQQYRDLNSCLSGLIPEVVGAWSAAQVKIYPDLMRYLTPEQQQVAMNAGTAMERIVQAINQAQQGPFYNPAVSPSALYQVQPVQQQAAWPNNQATWANQPPAQGWNQMGVPMGTSAPFGGAFQGTQGTNTSPSPLFVSSPRQPDPVITAPVLGKSPKTSINRMQEQLMRQKGIDPNPPATVMENAMETAYDRELAKSAVADSPSIQSAPTQAERSTTQPQKAWMAKRTAADSAAVYGEWSSVMGKLENPLPATESSALVTITGNQPPTATEADATHLVESVEENVSPSQWRPSVIQPYHPAWSASLYKCVYSKLEDGTVIAVIHNKTESEKAMNEADHAIGVRPMMKAAFQKEDNKVVKIESDEIVPIEYATTQIEFINNDDVSLEVSDRVPAVNAGILGVMGGWVNNKNSAWHTTTWIADPVLASSEDIVTYLVQSIERARSCTTFAQLHEVLTEMTTPDELVLRQRINQYMTRAINDVLAFNIGAGVYIDDFEADGDTIVDQITRMKGDRLGKAIASSQQHTIMSTLRALDNESSKYMIDSFKSGLVGDSSWKGSMTFLACKVTHTHLQYTAAELDLAMPRRVVAMLTREKTEMLFTVAEEIYNDDDLVKADYARHFIVTSDGVVLQLARGLLNTQAYLIRIVD